MNRAAEGLGPTKTLTFLVHRHDTEGDHWMLEAEDAAAQMRARVLARGGTLCRVETVAVVIQAEVVE